LFLKLWLNLNLMRAVKTYQIEDTELTKRKLLFWAQQFEQICVLESNSLTANKESADRYSSLDCTIALGAHSELRGSGDNDFEKLKSYIEEIGDWVFGYLTYDLKNQIEDLSSNHLDIQGFATLHFFQPEIICELTEGKLKFKYLKETKSTEEIDQLFADIQEAVPTVADHPFIEVAPRMTREEYINSVDRLKQHIAYGDIYEVNFCQEFFCHEVAIDPLPIYERLNNLSKAPFSTFYRDRTRYLLSASPERFMKKEGSTLLSQPIKGTKRRGDSEDLDMLYREELEKSEKERSENVMVVDLVRNDLSKSAVKGSVTVEELFGIYTFEQVHQMISTVKCELRPDVHPIDALKNAFPMGSMTGAPKVRAMKLIEQYELTRRGLYSGAVGYITPELDFDFNVVIRSILYNAEKRYLSFMVGGAITDMSEPEAEYDECMVKAKALFEVLSNKESVH